MRNSKYFKIYFGHSKLIYGTAREAEELEFIESQYPDAEIINPALLIDITEMKKFLKIVSKCTLVVASEFEGYVGKGVFAEISIAFARAIRVQVLRKSEQGYSQYPVTGIQVINEHDWKSKYAKLIVNN